jgi:hypothetical protein
VIAVILVRGRGDGGEACVGPVVMTVGSEEILIAQRTAEPCRHRLDLRCGEGDCYFFRGQ